jgi:hypothetical protein
MESLSTFRTVGYARSYNVIVNIDSSKITAGRSLPNVRREWAPCLIHFIIFTRVNIRKVVIALRILCKDGIVEQWGKINWSTLGSRNTI